MNSPLRHTSNLIKIETQVDYILLDGSSSMTDKWPDTIGAIDAYVQGLKDEKINSHIYLHVFSSSGIDMVAFHDLISAWDPIMGRLPCPGGMTPLYDAIGIKTRRMRDFDPPRARITIATDGEEMGSSHTDVVQARSYLDWCRFKGWPVTFIGCDFSNLSQAASLGADESNALGVQKRLLTDAARNYAKKAANHARGAEDINFTKDEQQQFGGYLAAPK